MFRHLDGHSHWSRIFLLFAAVSLSLCLSADCKAELPSPYLVVKVRGDGWKNKFKKQQTKCKKVDIPEATGVYTVDLLHCSAERDESDDASSDDAPFTVHLSSAAESNVYQVYLHVERDVELSKRGTMQFIANDKLLEKARHTFAQRMRSGMKQANRDMQAQLSRARSGAASSLKQMKNRWSKKNQPENEETHL